MIAGLLILGIIGAEVPELLSLVDNTSNDFVVRKIDKGGGAPALAIATNASPLLDTKHFGRDPWANGAGIFLGADVISCDLFLLHSVLRR
jgi:hypothetical protein